MAVDSTPNHGIASTTRCSTTSMVATSKWDAEVAFCSLVQQARLAVATASYPSAGAAVLADW